MDSFYLFIVIVLFALAISDLIVGVSNDAVNFLNSAIGAKAASFKVIMIVAAIGVLVGATFSSGMMEVARKGIFHPEHFYFNEIMIMFLAVMMTDIILLDAFNTLGLPTSTTVSIVFELLGAAVAISLIKINTSPDALQLGEYINTSKALLIITGILLSVVVSFSVGALVMYISRMIFSFNYKKRIQYFGAVFCGLALTAITYFMLIKGAKGASLMTSEVKAWIADNSTLIILYSFFGWTVLLQIAQMVFKMNILKFVVLCGTFALAMAFAGNDLVNFIGVPLAGLTSYKEWIASGAGAPELFGMGVLAGKVKTEAYLLLIAGIIMVITLWTSKKARSVVKTSLDLSRQDEGEERFGSSIAARSVVGISRSASKFFGVLIPKGVSNAINRQFDQTAYNESVALEKDPPAFDLVRASVNLVTASILIAFATSLKLPLSTTYVTFMVAMGTSLADKAWGRESAVYRVTGVLSVIGGWFLTAFMAFTVAFVTALVFYWGGVFAIFAVIVLVVVVILRTKKIHSKKVKDAADAALANDVDSDSIEAMLKEKCSSEVIEVLLQSAEIYTSTIESFNTEDRKGLKNDILKVNAIDAKAKMLKKNSYFTIKKMEDSSIDSGMYYVQVLDYLREMGHSLSHIVIPCQNHVENHHKVFSDVQKDEIAEACVMFNSFMNRAVDVIKNNDFDSIDNLVDGQVLVIQYLHDIKKKQLKRLKNEKASTKVTMLYISILQETKSIVLQVVNIIKAQRDFMIDETK